MFVIIGLLGLYFILMSILIILQKIVRFINWLLIKRFSPDLYRKIDQSWICEHQFPYLGNGSSSGSDISGGGSSGFDGGGGDFGGGGASGGW